MSRWALALAGLAACSRPDPPGRAAATDAATRDSLRSPESLALRAPENVEIWFTMARDATDSTGTPCVERVMEIRRGSTRIPIPLLYTGEAPLLVNDSTIQTHIWLHCRPGNLYRVHLKTGQPTWVR